MGKGRRERDLKKKSGGEWRVKRQVWKRRMRKRLEDKRRRKARVKKEV